MFTEGDIIFQEVLCIKLRDFEIVDFLPLLGSASVEVRTFNHEDEIW